MTPQMKFHAHAQCASCRAPVEASSLLHWCLMMGRGDCRVLTALLCLLALSGSTRGQGRVAWQYGIFGVTEGTPTVEVCANYSDAVEGFSVETSTTDVFAINGTDYITQIGSTSFIIWPANTTIACISITIVDDNRVENDEVFYVNMVRVVSDPDGATPLLEPQTFVIIMDDDQVPVVFTTDSITTTDDVPSVEVCVEVKGDLVDEAVTYRIPIAVATEGGTAVPGVDYETFNNMTAGERSRAVLTPLRPSHCFSISLLTRQDDGLDDRSFFVTVSLRDGTAMTVPIAELIKLPESDLEVIVQPAAQIEVGGITDSVLSNPLFSVSLDMEGSDGDSNLCFEVEGEPRIYLNLVSDSCFSINAHYDVIEGAETFNKIDQLLITASDAAAGCSDILIDASLSCSSVTLRDGAQKRELSERYRRNGLQIEFLDGRVEVTLPCRRYPGGGIKVVAKCNAEYIHPNSGERLPVKNLDLVFQRGKLESTASPMPHGLVAQFWRLEFVQELFTAFAREAFKVTTPNSLGSRSFLGFMFHLTWDLRNENCVYAGSSQGGDVRYTSAVTGTVIEGEYTDYVVSGAFSTDFEFNVFSRTEFSCPSV